MTLEQRVARAERMLILFVKAGRRSRSEWRKESRAQGDKIDILIDTQMRYSEEWRARHREMDEKINILINAQIATEDQLKRTDEQIQVLTASQVKTDEALDRLVASQAKTEDALQRFLNGVSKGRNGNPSD